jgi:hypothetical protein
LGWEWRSAMNLLALNLLVTLIRFCLLAGPFSVRSVSRSSTQMSHLLAPGRPQEWIVGFFTQADRSGKVDRLLDAYAASYEHAVRLPRQRPASIDKAALASGAGATRHTQRGLTHPPLQCR